jgi:hypothetical protein
MVGIPQVLTAVRPKENGVRRRRFYHIQFVQCAVKPTAASPAASGTWMSRLVERAN